MAPLHEPKITRRGFLSRGARLGLGALGLSAGALGWGRYFEPDWIEIKRLELRLPRLPRAFDGFRIAQISDIHIEGGEMRHHFPAIADLVSAQDADAIVLTGDYISGPGDWQAEALFRGFRRLRAREGVFAVLGNHDHWGRAQQPLSALGRAGVHQLHNKSAPIKRGGAVVWMAGLDDWLTSKADLPALL
ncbi:MAG: metallophosphoesterase, partial [Armatimonadetes bacterium]|nr:metallophosphoesterase [Armatimonadota bacterium]